MFIDRVKILVKGGAGGNGCSSFYSDKMSRNKIPDGGNGGDGGNVIFKASRNVFTLLDFKYRHEFAAASGKHGSGNNKRGKNGEDIVILIPLGTQVIDETSGYLLEDLNLEGKEVVVAKGGRGGCGNHTKREAQPGHLGEARDIILDLKLIADVGIIGFPNAGKSTLISQISSARPRIASYPFTTKDPVLGVVNTEEGKFSDDSFTIVDIPGLIEGAHQGRGLGDKFLRHVERTKVLIHLIDMAGTENRDPLSDYEILNKELGLYSKEILKKPQILVANKMDLEPAKDNLKRFKRKFKNKIIDISAKEKNNLDILIDEISKKL
ncbi:MAG: GTPase ObgE [Candidatus Omnitrophica bacterium]|nr:GTPase ObgE [Candidatus Omnitrophota bacterium]MDD5352727.1 GTPase ObgE [Candidatus Omnitrophota bacterium]MDD5550326.1 GTPase ObgE [Candidatus Omnitrophota bacterium]